jgi:glutathione S-transferase
MFTFFYAPVTCALASHIVLEETGAPYQAVRLDFSQYEQRKPEYLAINPKGRVPALVSERGVLTETPAILAFLAQSFPAAQLAPLDDPYAFAELQGFNSYLCSTVHVAHAHGRRGYRWAEDPAAIEAMKSKVASNMLDSFRLIEREYFTGPWLFGERYSVADAYLFTVAGWLERDGVDVTALPKMLEHRARMEARPAVQRALAQER